MLNSSWGPVGPPLPSFLDEGGGGGALGPLQAAEKISVGETFLFSFSKSYLQEETLHSVIVPTL